MKVSVFNGVKWTGITQKMQTVKGNKAGREKI